MGPERILQAARRLSALALVGASVAAAAPTKERVAVIDVGPADEGQARQAVAKAIVAGGLAPLIGDGIDDALAGQDVAPDAARLAAALADAQRAFGQLDCAATTQHAMLAVGLAAARQAAHLAVPELPRAWTYVLLCADRVADARGARTAIARLRTLGGPAAAPDVPADLWTKYPEIDALLDAEHYPLAITTATPGAEIWIDHARAGQSPLTVTLAAGEHVIAAATRDGKRGYALGTAVKTQTQVAIPTSDQRGPYGAIARRVASWGGVMPAASEIGAVLDAAKVRAAIVRRGDVLEAWGRPGRAGEPHRLGGDDGTGAIADAPRLVQLIADRAQTWDDRAPDPDAPLLTETSAPPLLREKRRGEEPAKWWVYATLAGAVVASGVLLYAVESQSETQRVELHVP